MVGNSPLEIRYLNPLMIFHSLYSFWNYQNWDGSDNYPEDGTGCLTGSLNQFATRAEVADNPNQPPNGLGYLAGLHFSHAFNTWHSVFFFEFVYTDPYLHILASPFASFIQMNPLENYYYIGYPRDTIAVTAGADFLNKDTLSFSGSVSWIARGEHSKSGLKWDWEQSPEAFNKRTPSGTAENNIILSIGGMWKPLPYLVLEANVTCIVSNTTSTQASLSVGIRY
jgi:hypothetical protein